VKKWICALVAAMMVFCCSVAFAEEDTSVTTTPAVVYNPGELDAPTTDVQLMVGEALTKEELITFTYRKPRSFTLDLHNVGKANAYDVTVTPVVSNDVSSFPFKITKVYWDETLVNAADATSDDLIVGGAANQDKGSVTFNFDVRRDAPTGYYPLTLAIEYKETPDATGTVGLQTMIYVKIVNRSLEDSGTTTDKPVSTPRLIVSGFRTEPEKVMAGQPFTLSLDLTNTASDVDISNIKMVVSSAEEGVFLPVSGSSTVFVRSIAAGKVETIQMEMNSRADLAPKSYAITVTMEYEGSNAAQYSASESVSVPVYQEAKLTFSDISVVPEAVSVGDSVNLMVNLYNMGKSKLSNVLVKLESDDMLSGEDYFAGNMDAGATSMMDVMLTANMPGEANCRLVASFEDEMGQSYSVEKEFFVYVEDYAEPAYSDEPFINDPMGEDNNLGETTQGKNWMLWTGVAAGVLAVAVIVIAVIRSSKKRRAQKKMDDFLSDQND